LKLFAVGSLDGLGCLTRAGPDEQLPPFFIFFFHNSLEVGPFRKVSPTIPSGYVNASKPTLSPFFLFSACLFFQFQDAKLRYKLSSERRPIFFPRRTPHFVLYPPFSVVPGVYFFGCFPPLWTRLRCLPRETVEFLSLTCSSVGLPPSSRRGVLFTGLRRFFRTPLKSRLLVVFVPHDVISDAVISLWSFFIFPGLSSWCVMWFEASPLRRSTSPPSVVAEFIPQADLSFSDPPPPPPTECLALFLDCRWFSY